MNTLKLGVEKKERLGAYYAIARNVAVVAGCFSVIVAVILAANYIQLRSADPINSPSLQKIMEMSRNDPGNEEMAKAAREYDLLARRAYFGAASFGTNGGYLLLVGICLMLAALKTMYELRRKIPDPGNFREIEEDPQASYFLRVSILGAFAVLMTAAFIIPAIFKRGAEEAFTTAISEAAPYEEALRNWPSFRGPGGLGVAYNTDPPVDWDGVSGRNILWKTEIPKPGANSPIIWNGKIFLSGADSAAREVYCLDLDTGQMLWKEQTSSGMNIKMPKVSEDSGLAAPTMATDGRFAAAVFATGELIVLDMDGNIAWEKKLEEPDNIYGHASSLITYNNLLIVQYDHEGEARVMAFDIASGRTVWQVKRDVESSWSSPVIARTSYGDQLVLKGHPYLTSYDPETGELIWEIKGIITGELGPSCAFSEDRIFAANQFAYLVCVDVKTGEILWQHEDNLPDASSPAASGGYLILPSSYEKVSCFNAYTGNMHWEHRYKSPFYASPVISGDRVYMTDRKGVTRIFALDGEFRSISDPEIGEDTVATPAFVGDRIIIRAKNNVYCVGEKE